MREKKSHQNLLAERIFGWPSFTIVCDIPIFYKHEK